MHLVGKTIGGRYKIKGVLGEGGMGTVFDAEHLGLGRGVAVKVLSPSQAKKSVAVKRFQQEARAAGAIGHPNICEVYDFGVLDDSSPYLVMEKLIGQTLADRIAKEGGLPFDDVIQIACQVLGGLSAAHEKGIIHRDIKPENIFLSRRPGSSLTVKLLDFGVSKMMAEFQNPDDALDLTRTGMVMGTPYYMSPEQARGERNLDGRVDVYACGVVMYEAIAGRRPFLAPNYNALLLAIINTIPKPVRDLRPSTPPELDAIIARAMSRSRHDRFASAREMLRELAPSAEASSIRRPLVMPQPTHGHAAPRAMPAAPRGKSPEPPPARAAASKPLSSVDIPVHFSTTSELDDVPLDEDDATEEYRPVPHPPVARAHPTTKPVTARLVEAPATRSPQRASSPPSDEWEGETVMNRPVRDIAPSSPPPPFNPEQTLKLDGRQLDDLGPGRVPPRRRR